jgi:hypothetical protein
MPVTPSGHLSRRVRASARAVPIRPHPALRPLIYAAMLASLFAIAATTRAPAETYGQAKVDPLSLAERDLADETRGDVAGAVALYSDDGVIQNGGLCAPACVGKEAIQKEIERRVAAKNRWKVVGKYVSGNVAVVKTELQIGYIEASGVDRVVVWCLYEVKDGKIAVATTIGQRTDPQTAQFIKWVQQQRNAVR